MAKVKVSNKLSKNKKPVHKIKAPVSMAASAKKPAKKPAPAKGKASSSKKVAPAKKASKPSAPAKKPLPKKPAPAAKKPAPKVVAKKPAPSKPSPHLKDAPKNAKPAASTHKIETKANVATPTSAKSKPATPMLDTKVSQGVKPMVKVGGKVTAKSEDTVANLKEAPKAHKPILIPDHLKKLQAQLEKIEDKPASTASDEPQKIPQSELFTEQELSQFMTALENERDKLLGKTEATVNAGSIALNKDEMYDEVDLASATVDQNLTFRLLDRDRKLLGEIDHAIMKIQSGDYGYCEGTGEPIPKRRLELRPWCKYSVKYKEQLERMKKSGRGVVDEDEEIFA
jgi:DnaK suppressor protein